MSESFVPVGIDLDKTTQHVAAIFLHGLRQIGAKTRAEEEIWFQRQPWGCVVDMVNSLPDGDYNAEDIAKKARDEYLRLIRYEDAPVLPGEMVVWSACVRALFEVIEEGEILPEHSTDGWDGWIRERLASEGLSDA